MREADYTPERRPRQASDEPESASGFEAGYRKGYEAGLAAARERLDHEDTATLTERKAETADNSGDSPEPRAASGIRRSASNAQAEMPETKKLLPSQEFGETTETEAPETSSPAEVASLHVDTAGMPTSLRGSLASLERQNERVEADGLERILDEADLNSRIAHKLLVPLPVSAALTVNPDLEENHRYCRPWTARFAADLARAHEAVFHKPIEVNSAVRTVEYQKRLMSINGNAAAAEGDIVSPHLTGATIDIGKREMSSQEIAWMRRQLLGLQMAGKIDAEEEFEQACFHITVYKSYLASLPHRKAAQPGSSRRAATQHKASQPAADRPASHLPEDLAVGAFGAQGR
jgi:hypothetical protein